MAQYGGFQSEHSLALNNNIDKDAEEIVKDDDKTNLPKTLKHNIFREERMQISLAEQSKELLIPYYSMSQQERLQNLNNFKLYYNTTSEFRNQPCVNVRFLIEDIRFVTAYSIRTNVAIIVKQLANILDVGEDTFNLEVDNEKIEDTSTLLDLGAHPNTIFIFHLIPKHDEQENIISKVRENIPTLDVIIVHLREGIDVHRDIIVEISKQCPNKEWLGGFRNKLTNVEYHNAVAQTLPSLKSKEESLKRGNNNLLMFHRDTQTPFKPRNRASHTLCNQMTQTYRSDLYINASNDKIIIANNYGPENTGFTSIEMINAVTIIQRNIRKWICNRRMRKLLEYNEEIRADIRRQKREIRAEEANKEREIITSTVFPVNRDDFYMLYLMVNNWWKEEWRRISTFSKESKQAESTVLLSKEVLLLKEIEKQRIVGKKEALQKAKMRFLEQTSSPSMFTNVKGDMTSIDDIPTQRAREFKEIYSELIHTTISPEERIHFLLTFKQLFSVDYRDYEYANDLVSLIDREIDMLTMGIQMKNLSGLHRRIEQLYMQFLQQKEFNPKCERYQEPNKPKTIHTLFQCTRCRKLLPTSKFPVHVRMKVYDVCTSCTWLKNIGCNRIDMSPYVKMLRSIRNAEIESCCHQAVCFIFRPIGMCYLTTMIWHGRSAISECSDVFKLQHIRWLSHLEWSPWNTILLTNQEVKCHRSIQDVFSFYSKTFIEKIKYKHIHARTCFYPLLKMNHEICYSGDWSKVKDAGIYLHPSNAAIFNTVNEYDKF